MAAKLDTPQGQALYKQRKAITEPVFAQLSARFGRTLHYRGDMVTTEIHLWAAVHNTLKAIRARARREQRERQAAAQSPPWPPHSQPPERGHDQAKPGPQNPRQLTRPARGSASARPWRPE